MVCYSKYSLTKNMDKTIEVGTTELPLWNKKEAQEVLMHMYKRNNTEVSGGYFPYVLPFYT